MLVSGLVVVLGRRRRKRTAPEPRGAENPIYTIQKEKSDDTISVTSGIITYAIFRFLTLWKRRIWKFMKQ